MKQIQGLTSNPKQQFTIPLDDGTRVSLFMQYYEQQMGWFLDLVWGEFELRGIRVCASPNILRQWQNIIPFGLCIVTSGNVEPLNLTDFQDATAVVLLLNSADVTLINNAAYFGS